MKLKHIDKMPERLFVVGDIHGCLAELRLMLEFLTNNENFNSNDILVFVGDYIDRGDNARGVIQYLIDFKEQFNKTVFLKGNHEDMLLSYLTSNKIGIRDSYLANGGLKTLESYNAPMNALSGSYEDEQNTIERHLDFFYSLESAIVIGDYIIAHAGLDPMKSLDEQTPDDLYWIREDFICNPHEFGKTVIFGHTPYHDVLFDLPYKIGIDTGLVYGNMLTCVELVNKKVYQIEKNGDFVIEGTFDEFKNQDIVIKKAEEMLEDDEEDLAKY